VYEIATIGELGAPPKKPCCSACAEPRRARPCAGGATQIGDVIPEALALQNAGFLPDVVWPSDVDRYKASLDPKYIATDADAHRCTSLPAPSLVAWSKQFDAWRAFAVKSTPTFGAANQWELAHKFESELLEWQNQIGASCGLSAPKAAPPDRTFDASFVKWIAGAAIVLGLAYVASPLIMASRKAAR
jgi:hypothetical protein